MDDIRQYILSVVAAAVICSIVISISGKNTTHGTIIKLLTGIFLSITVIAPWSSLQIQDVSSFFSSVEADAEEIITAGDEAAINEASAIITQQTEAYILDKASSLGLTVQAEVILTQTEPMTPCAVTLHGSASPYAKARLEQMIETDLGIRKENQTWK